MGCNCELGHPVFQKDLSIGMKDGVHLLPRLPVKIAYLLMENFVTPKLPFFLYREGHLQHKKQGLRQALVKFSKYGPQFFKADIGANQLPFINLELFLDFLWKGDGHSRCGLKYLLFPPSNFYMIGVKIALLLSRAAFPPRVCTAARNPGFSANTSLWKKNGPIHASSKTWETACSAGVKKAE